MIVNPTMTGWDIIYHRAHALLAAQLGGQWRKKDSPPRLYETIATISHHDDLEREWEENILTDAGAPMDFTLDQNPAFDRLYLHIERALYRGRWVALLTSMHLSRLNKDLKGKNKEADRFLETQLAQQKQWLKELSITQQDADSAYDFLQWCDRLSLILCQQELPEDERALEISKAHDGQRYDIKQLKNGLISVTPWCFENERFTVNVEYSSLNEVKFKDNKTLIEALKKAPRNILEWTFVKAENS
ncbi:DUF3891 domain-containing protein [Aphanothece hegewaldii CCALA 016]|uniref:DUF3891 domain-containing protein n=1 Tax=Aphanothece hegewaldii CCALA 016 TaxID=2107694 RepID=A0A2T1M2Q4_9CHRO|nr:DUF3891 family protein [Aphanothece hegewaldii]PSF39023.1 DUF3891 domain-containing protein [Aphanothece hegewaldii CCALA 016]